MKQAEENHRRSGGMNEDRALDNCEGMEDDGVLDDGVEDKDDRPFDKVEPTSDGLQSNGNIFPKQRGRK